MGIEFRVYRPNSKNNGVATAFQLRTSDEKYDNVLLFMVVAPQTGVDDKGNAKFDWKGGITVKLGENDIGQLLAVINGKIPAINNGKGLYHKTPNGGNKVVVFNRNDNGGYYLKVSGQDKENKLMGNFAHVVNDGEGEILRILLERTIQLMYNW